MFIQKENLQGSHYAWKSSPASSTYTGKPSRRLFDRDNGNQVLFIINSFASETGTFSVQDAHRIEKMLIHELPIDTKSEISVFNWLKEASVCVE